MLYTFDGTTSTYQPGYTVADTSSNREPAYLSAYDSNTFTEEGIQSDFNYMVLSVNNYKGFWIARYEGSWDDTQEKIASIAGAESVHENFSATKRWKGLYTAMKDYSEDNLNYISSMPWGCQWDSMMNWMAAYRGITVGTDTPISGTACNDDRYITGTPEYNDKLNNIFDLYGNKREYTIEAITGEKRVCRGGNYAMRNSPSNREGIRPTLNNWATLTARPTLCLKMPT